MKIKVNRKNLLEAAELCAKLVIPSKSPIEALPNMRLSASTKLYSTELTASNGEETVAASVIDSHPESDCDTMINCAALLALLRSVASGYVTLEIHDRLLDIYTDDTPAGTLTATNAAGDPVAPSVPKNADAFILPSNFAQLMHTAFKFTSKDDDTPAFAKGVNLSLYGVTASNGHVLFHIPVPMRMNGGLTLARPVLPTSMGNLPLTMKIWNEKNYEIRGTGFALYGRGMDVKYPKWQDFVPKDAEYKGDFTLSGDLRELVSYLKTLGKDEWAKVSVSAKSIVFNGNDGSTFEFPAKGSCIDGRILRIKGCDLLTCIEMGHDKIQFTDDDIRPYKATGGRGFFVFMPMKDDTANTGSSENTTTETTATTQMDGGAESSNAVETNQNNTNQNKEKTEMTQSSTITRFPSTTPQIQTQPQQQSQPLNAFEELEKLFEGLRATQAIYNEQMANISRKLKAAVTADRQRAREYNKAIGRLEAVRKAI
ncbi:MAG: hypothetical protein IKP58_01085 [Victivallales bacterium]|nr:hypothetical protein [Victivallales bacterium]